MSLCFQMLDFGANLCLQWNLLIPIFQAFTARLNFPFYKVAEDRESVLQEMDHYIGQENVCRDWEQVCAPILQEKPLQPEDPSASSGCCANCASSMRYNIIRFISHFPTCIFMHPLISILVGKFSGGGQMWVVVRIRFNLRWHRLMSVWLTGKTYARNDKWYLHQQIAKAAFRPEIDRNVLCWHWEKGKAVGLFQANETRWNFSSF